MSLVYAIPKFNGIFVTLIIIILWKRCACRLTQGWEKFSHEGPRLKRF